MSKVGYWSATMVAKQTPMNSNHNNKNFTLYCIITTAKAILERNHSETLYSTWSTLFVAAVEIPSEVLNLLHDLERLGHSITNISSRLFHSCAFIFLRYQHVNLMDLWMRHSTNIFVHCIAEIQHLNDVNHYSDEEGKDHHGWYEGYNSNNCCCW